MEMTFNELLEHRALNDAFVNAQYVCELFKYLKRNNIHERKERIKVFKYWFLSGKDIPVNGSARGRVVLRYEPELLYLLKIGFIKQDRYKRFNRCSQTVLVLNDN